MYKATAIAVLLAFVGSARVEVGTFHPQSMAYVLQAERLGKTSAAAAAKLAASDRDLIVIDPSYTDEERWTAEQIAMIRAGKPGRKVVAYLSIGEAENYRAYWQKGWKPGAPAWLGEENRQWRGNFSVAYWDAAWQAIILAELGRIVDAGFDGVYLDIVDAFETYEYDAADRDWIDDRPNPTTGQTYRRDMVEWVNHIAATARAQTPGFLVIPQNAPQLLAHADFLATIDLIAVEDLFTNGNRAADADDKQFRQELLERAVAAERTVVCVEYARKAKHRKAAADEASEAGYTLLITDRNLKKLGECPLVAPSE